MKKIKKVAIVITSIILSQFYFPHAKKCKKYPLYIGLARECARGNLCQLFNIAGIDNLELDTFFAEEQFRNKNYALVIEIIENVIESYEKEFCSEEDQKINALSNLYDILIKALAADGKPLKAREKLDELEKILEEARDKDWARKVVKNLEQEIKVWYMVGELERRE